MACVPFRFWIAVMIFLTTYINFSTRVNMSISIISMVSSSKGKKTPECLGGGGKKQGNTTAAKTVADTDPTYDWDETVQGQILGSYFLGFVISSLPGGDIAEFVGPFNTILLSHIVTAIINEFCVFAPEIHYLALIATRFAMGLVAGAVYPACYSLIAHWAPPNEKGKFVSALMGNTLGTCATFAIVGKITTMLGWKWGFHFITIQMLVFCVIFWFVASDSPETHRCVSEEEKNFIVESHAGSLSNKKAVAPYKAMFSSFVFWVLVISQFGNLWGLYLQATGVPKYMSEVIGFDLAKSGFFSALPQLGRLFFGVIFGSATDMLTKKGICSKLFVRKFFSVFSHILPGILLITISFVGCNWIPIVMMLTMSMGLNGAAVVTNLQNAQDLSPNFCGTIFGIISCIGGTTGFITPMVTAFFIKENNGIVEWAYNFWCGGLMYIIGGIVFMLFASVDIQPWNTIPD